MFGRAHELLAAGAPPEVLLVENLFAGEIPQSACQAVGIGLAHFECEVEERIVGGALVAAQPALYLAAQLSPENAVDEGRLIEPGDNFKVCELGV